MRWHTIILLLVLQISLCFVQGFIPSSRIKKTFGDLQNETQPLMPCATLQEEWSWVSITNREAFEKQTHRMVLLWEEALGHAAAALLRATLIAAEYNADEITLHDRHNFTDQEVINNQSLVVEVNMAARLHVRLTPRALATDTCRNISTWSFYMDNEILRMCEFGESRTQESRQIIVYILNEWERTCTAEIIRQFAATSNVWTDVVYLDRSHLTHFMGKSPRSFFFLDTDHWSYFPSVRTAQLPNGTVAAAECGPTLEKAVSFNVNDEFSAVLYETFAVFSPSLNDLRNVIELKKQNYSMEEAACEWARQRRELISRWRKTAVVKPALSMLAVLICKVEVQDLNEYLYLTGLEEISKNLLESKIQIQVFYVDCIDTDWLLRKLFNWFSKNFLTQIAGVVLTEDMAIAVAPLAEKFQLPLLTYDVSTGESAVRSATGRSKYLGQAFHRLLADCSWKRLAILSEPTRLAASLSTALRISAPKLVIREVNVTSSPINNNHIRHALKGLLAVDARVFFVNTGAATASTVLAIAQELNITWEKGFTWIVREYCAADKATAVTRPYSVSFWSRRHFETTIQHKGNETKHLDPFLSGFSDIEQNSDQVQLRRKLETRWQRRAWPLHAAPLMDALITIGEGFKRLNMYRNAWLSAHKDGALREFWDGIQRKSIPGINEDLLYDEKGVMAPLLFVEQWGAEPRPRLLAAWRSGKQREFGEACPANNPHTDGAVACLVPSGDPFNPNCSDAIWISFITLAMLLVVALIVVAIWGTRYALTTRDHRIKTEFAKRLLERRERVFAALADHLVDRSAIELLQELGKGRFGRVHLGILRESGRKGRNVVVAAKALREEAAPAEESEFLKEACTLSALDHEHIVRFVGVCIVDGPPLILMEHAFFGDLLRYLQDRRYLADGVTATDRISTGVGLEEKAYVSAEALTKLALEAAAALAYIAQRGIVHRDVRASNCLVDERRSLKLADFGLSRATGTIDGEYACRRGMFPVLWMAPESLATGVSSVASDVWSFGVLVFELVTLGRRPYGSKPPPTVLRHVVAGGQPQLPWDASAETRALVSACWRRQPETRPTAARLMEWLSTHRRALRPALVEELVDIDSQLFGNSEVSAHDFDALDTSLSKVIQ